MRRVVEARSLLVAAPSCASRACDESRVWRPVDLAPTPACSRSARRTQYGATDAFPDTAR